MKDMTNMLTSYKLYEYLLVLNPHEELHNKIMHVRQEFYNTYKNDTALYNRPHITLVRFVQYEMMEERILNRLNIVGMGFHPIKVELKGYGSFPSHTIYINITSKLPVQDLIKQIRGQTQRFMKLDADNKPHFMMEPQLTIARKLQPWQYEKGWLEYSHKYFTGRFIADSMLLLKRPIAGSDSYRMKYQIVRRFEFQNLPVSTKQGELFG